MEATARRRADWALAAILCAAALGVFGATAGIVLGSSRPGPATPVPARRTLRQVFVPRAQEPAPPVAPIPDTAAAPDPDPAPPDPLPAAPPEPLPRPAPPAATPAPATRWEVMSAAALPARPAPEEGTKKGGAPRQDTFSEKVLPLLDSQCAGCHARAGLPVGGFSMTPPGKGGHSAATRRKNFETALKYVREDAPEKSPLVLKPLALAEGGTEHGGGDILHRGSDTWVALLGWASGSGPADLRPRADAGHDQAVAPGLPAFVDGSASRDLAGRQLRFAWKILAAPDGAAATLELEDAPRARLKPDREGTWLLELIVTDPSKARSLPARVRVRCLSPAAEGPAPRNLVSRSRALDALSVRFLGHPASGAELDRLLVTSRQDIASMWSTSGDFWEAALERDLAHLDLSGEFRPEKFDAAIEAVRIANGSTTIADAWKRLLEDPALGRRFPSAGDAIPLLLRRVCGETPAPGAALPSWIQLPSDLTSRPGFAPAWLERHARHLGGKAPSAADLERWATGWPATATAAARAWAAEALR